MWPFTRKLDPDKWEVEHVTWTRNWDEGFFCGWSAKFYLRNKLKPSKTKLIKLGSPYGGSTRPGLLYKLYFKHNIDIRDWPIDPDSEVN